MSRTSIVLGAGWLRLWVRIQLVVWRFGAALPVAVVLGLIAGFTHILGVLPAQSAREAVARDAMVAAGARASAARAASATLAATQAATAAGRAFPSLPEDASALIVLRRMDMLAREQGVELAHAEYQIESHPTLAVRRLRVVQPLRTSYAHARRYAAAVLKTEVGISLDQASFKRESIASAAVEARLVWSLWIPMAPDTRHVERGGGDTELGSKR